MDIVFAHSHEKKLAKKEKLAAKQEKFEKWEDGWKEKQRKGDSKKVKRVQKQRAKEEASKTSFERNADKYQAWSTDDKKSKMILDRYTEKRAEPTVRPSSFIGSKNPTKLTTNEIRYTPKVSLSDQASASSGCHPGTSLPRPSTFSNDTVELRYKNNVCYWPVSLVTLENLQNRFGLRKPAMRLASIPKGPLAIKFKVQPDGTFQVQGGQSYVIFNLKDKKAGKVDTEEERALTYEEKVLRFLTMAKFTRGVVLPTSMGAKKMILEETFEFTPEGRFAYREFKGYKDVEGSVKQQLFLVGKYKLKNGHKTVLLVFDKDKKKGEANRAQDRVGEKKKLYAKFFIPGDGTLQCYADQSVRFK